MADLFGIEFLKLQNDGVFDLIKSNPNMFVCCHKNYVDHRITGLNEKEKSEERKHFIKDYFDYGTQYNGYADLIELLFPNYGDYGGNELIGDNRERAEKGKRIYSGKYFYTYFVDSATEYTKINVNLKNILSIKDLKSFYKSLDNIFDSYSVYDHSAIMKQIDQMKDWENVEKNNLLKYMIDRYHWFEDCAGFFSISSKTMSIYISSYLFSKCDDGTFASFVKIMAHKGVFELVMLNKIIHRLKQINDESPSDSLSNRIDKLTHILDKKIDIIYNDSLDIYSDSYYDQGITWVLYHKNSKKTVGFVKQDFYKHNVMAFLNDFITVSVSDKVMYHLDVKSLSIFFTLGELEKIVESSIVYNNNYMIIKKIFNLAKNPDGEDIQEKGLEFNIDNQPTFHYDFYGKGSISRKGSYFEDF